MLPYIVNNAAPTNRSPRSVLNVYTLTISMYVDLQTVALRSLMSTGLCILVERFFTK